MRPEPPNSSGEKTREHVKRLALIDRLGSSWDEVAASSLGRRFRGHRLVRAAFYALQDLTWVGVRKTVWEIEGNRMYLNPWEPSPLRRTFRGYIRTAKEPLTTRLFKEVIRPGQRVADFGANIGYFTLLAARLVGPAGRVFAFEPEPRNFACLSRNITLNGCGHVTAFDQAAWHTAGVLKLYRANERDTGAHTLREAHAMWYFDAPRGGAFVEVETVVPDDLLANEAPIDVVKMDIEGAEMGALLGMAKTIDRSPGLILFVEFFPQALREMGHAPRDFLALVLDRYGFSGIALDEPRTDRAQVQPVRQPEDVLRLCPTEDKTINLVLSRDPIALKRLAGAREVR
jgi:FkbM family methyltransferase